LSETNPKAFGLWTLIELNAIGERAPALVWREGASLAVLGWIELLKLALGVKGHKIEVAFLGEAVLKTELVVGAEGIGWSGPLYEVVAAKIKAKPFGSRERSSAFFHKPRGRRGEEKGRLKPEDGEDQESHSSRGGQMERAQGRPTLPKGPDRLLGSRSFFSLERTKRLSFPLKELIHWVFAQKGFLFLASFSDPLLAAGTTLKVALQLWIGCWSAQVQSKGKLTQAKLTFGLRWVSWGNRGGRHYEPSWLPVCSCRRRADRSWGEGSVCNGSPICCRSDRKSVV